MSYGQAVIGLLLVSALIWAFRYIKNKTYQLSSRKEENNRE